METLILADGPDCARVASVMDLSGVSAARRAAGELSARLSLNETDAGRAALVVTEAATNVLKHAGGGQLVMRAARVPAPSLEILAIDEGPGLDPVRLRGDGFSSAGTLGAGLGAMRRMSSEFDVYARPGAGTVIRMAVRPMAAVVEAGFEIGVIAVPYPGEDVSGDAWSVRIEAGRLQAVVADGLGHGLQAADAALAATRALRATDEPPARALERMHAELRSTRGAAVAVAGVDALAGRLTYAGIGNIGGVLVRSGGARHMLSHTGIVGYNARRFQEVAHPWGADSLLIMSSDGLGSHWSLNDYPGLAERHPALVAAVLYRDHSRRRDDLVILALRQRPRGEAT